LLMKMLTSSSAGVDAADQVAVLRADLEAARGEVASREREIAARDAALKAEQEAAFKLAAARDREVADRDAALRTMEARLAERERELTRARARLDAWEQQSSEVGATAVAYAVALLRSHLPELNPGLLERGFACPADRERLVDAVLPAAQRFVERAGFSFDSGSDEEAASPPGS
jgi:hypothetical protein